MLTVLGVIAQLATELPWGNLGAFLNSYRPFWLGLFGADVIIIYPQSIICQFRV